MVGARQIDHGYAWVALASSSFMSLLINGFWSSLGVIFVEWEKYFDVTPAETALVGSMFLLILWGIAPISSALFKKLTHRVVVVLTGAITVICLFAITLVTHFWHIYIIMTILGISLGQSYQPAFTFFVFFFDKYFAAAHMLNGAATGIGVLSVPPIMEYLISYYGWKGAFQITAAVMANLSVCGLLLNTPEPIKPKTNDITAISHTLTESTKIDQAEPLASTNSCIVFLKIIARDLDVSLFYNVRFIIQTIVNGALRGAYAAALIYIVPYAVSVGIPDRESSLLMLAYGLAATLIQFSPMGLIVDKKIITASNMGGLAHIMMGILFIVMSFTTTYALIMTLAVLFGVLQGIGGTMLYVVVAQSAGSRDKGPAADAWFLLLNGIGTMVVLYLVGYLYNYTGSYRWSLILCGACLFVVGLNLLLDILLIRWQHRRSEDKVRRQSLLETPVFNHNLLVVRCHRRI